MRSVATIVVAPIVLSALFFNPARGDLLRDLQEIRNEYPDCFGVLNLSEKEWFFNETTGNRVHWKKCVRTNELLLKRIGGALTSPRPPPDLTGVNLSGAFIPGTFLPNANLRGADLKNAQLYGSNLSGANLSGADVRGARLREAKFVGTNLRAANLKKANLMNAQLVSADLEGTNLSEVDLSNANLRAANLAGANLTDAILQNAHLAGASLKGTTLNGARFLGASVSLAQLSAAKWAGVVVEGTIEKALQDFQRGASRIVGETPSRPTRLSGGRSKRIPILDELWCERGEPEYERCEAINRRIRSECPSSLNPTQCSSRLMDELRR